MKFALISESRTRREPPVIAMTSVIVCFVIWHVFQSAGLKASLITAVMR